jgi:tRNA isopentenyl-2-thiomethyl-A-37 hydroxylase MiaE
MAAITAHLSVEGLRERYVSSLNAREARHFQTIWLLAKGHSVGEVAEMTSKAEPASIGGQKSPMRSNQPETVSRRSE